VEGKANPANSNTASSKFSAPASAANNESWRAANTQQGGRGAISDQLIILILGL